MTHLAALSGGIGINTIKPADFYINSNWFLIYLRQQNIKLKKLFTHLAIVVIQLM